MRYYTGYFSSESSRTKVHVIDEHQKVLCVSVIAEDKRFLKTGEGIVLPHITCSRCLNSGKDAMLSNYTDPAQPQPFKSEEE